MPPPRLSPQPWRRRIPQPIPRVDRHRGRPGRGLGSGYGCFDRSTNLLDEGSTAAQALRILNGDLIYRDFFTVVTPGAYYTVASLFQIFGEQLMVLRWAALVTGLAIALVTLAIGRQIASWPFAAAAALMTTVWGWFLIPRISIRFRLHCSH